MGDKNPKKAPKKKQVTNKTSMAAEQTTSSVSADNATKKTTTK